MSRLGVFHAVAVHFPIALILAAALAQLLILSGRFANGSETVRFLVWTGALGGVAAGLLGWAHSGPMGANEAGVMLYHRMIGSVLKLGLGALIGLAEWNRRSPSTLLLSAMDGMPLAQIGEIMGISPKAAEVRVYRARKLLKEHFAGEG